MSTVPEDNIYRKHSGAVYDVILSQKRDTFSNIARGISVVEVSLYGNETSGYESAVL